MSTHEIPVVRIDEIQKHPNADSLGLVQVFGWSCAVRLGQFKPGDLAVYVPPDYIVDTTRPEFAFLATEGKTTHRVKVKRLRGTYSQGLIIEAPTEMKEGDNALEPLGIVRYEPPEPSSTSGDNESGPSGIFAPKYDVESLHRFSELLQDGEEVVATEKLHGCVPSTARIMMVDGSQRCLPHVKVGDIVMGVNEDGQPIPSRVIRKYKNGRATEGWVRISGRRLHAGRGSCYFALLCTPDHRVWCENRNEYIAASELMPGDCVISARTDPALSPLQFSVLLGKLLGDGSFYDHVHTASITWGHREKDAGYLEWIARALGGLAGSVRKWLSGYGTPMKSQRTVGSNFVKKAFADFYSAEHTKRVPEWVAEALDPIALAFWYMDDGSLGNHKDQEDRAHFAVCDFTKEDCEVLRRGLRRLGINSVYYVADGYSRLRLNAESAERLFLLVAPYIPPCMQRKLPERYRGHKGWLPREDATFKPFLVKQVIGAVTRDDTIKSWRYDLETETHNYFAYGTLVHNCNGRYVWSSADDRIFCGSRTNWKAESDKSVWWRALAKNPWIKDWCKAHPDLVLYGEVFGQVQDLKYGSGKNDVFFAAFDILRRGEWLSYDEAHPMLKVWAPLVYRGPFRRAKLIELADTLDSVWPGAQHLAEGIVVKPVVERTDPEIGRVQLKIVSNRYLCR